jgi:hypothetical protein
LCLISKYTSPIGVEINSAQHQNVRKDNASKLETNQITMSTQMLSHPYGGQSGSHYSYVSQPQGPPSPPMDEASKCSLPSISNLLGLADQGSPTTETSPQNQQPQGKDMTQKMR